MSSISFEQYLKLVKFEDDDMEKDICNLIKDDGIEVHLKLTFEALKEASNIVHTYKGLKHFVCGGYKASGNKNLEILAKALYQMDMLIIYQHNKNDKNDKNTLITEFVDIIKTNHEVIKTIKDSGIRGLMFIAFFECVRLTYIFLDMDQKNYTTFLKNVQLTPVLEKQ